MPYLFFLTLLTPLLLLCVATYRRIGFFNACLLMALMISVTAFAWELDNSHDYYDQVDGFGSDYTPFAFDHTITLYTFLTLSFIALTILWIKQRNLPPLVLITLAGLVSIGVVIHVVIIMQVSKKTDVVSGNISDDLSFFCLLPIVYLVLTAVVITRLLLSESKLAANRTYKYTTLNRLNTFIAKAQWQPVWVLLLTLPLFLLVTLVLILFGQDSHAITKVFTETTTWRFSTESHPPILDHKGHYLCTVAACGDPSVVKPIAWGHRHGYPIIVNRQLQIANAFEELVQDSIPPVHRMIRNIYDKYGYPLSKKISSPRRSNITYWLMKPLEFLFLLVLYLSCINPEQKIARQYLS